jgi:ABC-type uncharacterized transport system substrate-binding protein
MGKQGGEMAVSLVDGNGISDSPPVSPRRTVINFNPYVLRKLGLKPEIGGNRYPE